MRKVSRGLQANMLLRSFFVQACWNFEKLQNLGFALLIYPVVGKGEGAGRNDGGAAMKRHMDYFNTHPYFAGLVAAAVASEEGSSLDEGRFLDDLKRSLMSTLGSIGDGFFWAALRPLVTILAVLPALFGLLWAPFALLAVYNAIHLYVRWWGIGAGLRYGCHVIKLLEKLPLLRLRPLFSTLGSLAAGAAAGLAAVHPAWHPLPASPTFSVLVGLFIFLVSMAMAQNGAQRT